MLSSCYVRIRKFRQHRNLAWVILRVISWRFRPPLPSGFSGPIQPQCESPADKLGLVEIRELAVEHVFAVLRVAAEAVSAVMLHTMLEDM